MRTVYLRCTYTNLGESEANNNHSPYYCGVSRMVGTKFISEIIMYTILVTEGEMQDISLCVYVCELPSPV